MGKDVIIALDFDSKEKTLAFLDRFTERKALCEDRHGAVLRRRPVHRPGDQGAGATRSSWISSCTTSPTP